MTILLYKAITEHLDDLKAKGRTQASVDAERRALDEMFLGKRMFPQAV